MCHRIQESKTRVRPDHPLGFRLAGRLAVLELARVHGDEPSDEHDGGGGGAEDEGSSLGRAHVVHLLRVDVSGLVRAPELGRGGGDASAGGDARGGLRGRATCEIQESARHRVSGRRTLRGWGRPEVGRLSRGETGKKEVAKILSTTKNI